MFLDIVDRRKNPKDKSLVNRQRFLKRHAKAMRQAVRKKISEADVEDLASAQPKKIEIPTGGTDQPVFRHGEGGVRERVLPGNEKFVVGDQIPRPEAGGKGAGRQGAPDGDGEDDFSFEISQEEFLHYFFDGLELPDMVKEVLTGNDQFKVQRAGFSTEGTPSNIDPIRTMRHSHARRIAFRMPKLRRKRKLEEERGLLERRIADGGDCAGEKRRLVEVEVQIETLERQIKAIPFLDDVDVRYRRHEQVPVPISQAVMFCILDVSGSMGAWEKEMAKRFFMLLYLFLVRSYEKVEVVFIRHHHTAKEVDEEEFFRSRESGGTVVSTALNLMGEIVEERYAPTQWNIYGCQASDGDNFAADLPVAYETLVERIMPLVQHYAYVEVDKKEDSDLWPMYQRVGERSPNFAMARIADASDIYPVFRGLFEKDQEGAPHG